MAYAKAQQPSKKAQRANGVRRSLPLAPPSPQLSPAHSGSVQPPRRPPCASSLQPDCLPPDSHAQPSRSPRRRSTVVGPLAPCGRRPLPAHVQLIGMQNGTLIGRVGQKLALFWLGRELGQCANGGDNRGQVSLGEASECGECVSVRGPICGRPRQRCTWLDTCRGARAARTHTPTRSRPADSARAHSSHCASAPHAVRPPF